MLAQKRHDVGPWDVIDGETRFKSTVILLRVPPSCCHGPIFQFLVMPGDREDMGIFENLSLPRVCLLAIAVMTGLPRGVAWPVTGSKTIDTTSIFLVDPARRNRLMACS